MPPTPSSNDRPTRRRGAARAAILTAARTSFGERGYDGTNMRDVAQLAEVSEALLYRYFPSKEALFEQAIVGPFQVFVEEFLSGWSSLDRRLPSEVMMRRFITGLYGFVSQNRDLLFALVAANRFGPRGINDAGALSRGVQQLARFSAIEAAERGFGHVDLEMATACTVGMVLAMGLLDDLLFGHGTKHPSKRRLIEQMSLYATAGVQQHPAAKTTGRGSRKR